MKWFKFEPQEEEITETETSPVLVYLSPEALKHTVIVDDFSSFQDSPECIPGGRLFEVSRQYSYRLRQVADLVEEPLEDHNLQMKVQAKRNFHAEKSQHHGNNRDQITRNSPLGPPVLYVASSTVSDLSDTWYKGSPLCRGSVKCPNHSGRVYWLDMIDFDAY